MKFKNFRGLVLGCINADVCKQIRIFSVFRDLQSPLSGGKKCAHFSSPEKKEHLEVLGGALAAQVATNQRLTLGQPSVNVGSTLGQPSVNLRSTFGIFPSHLGPIFADFAGFVD